LHLRATGSCPSIGTGACGQPCAHVAIGCYAALAVALALTGTFAKLAVWATLATAALYIGGAPRPGAWFAAAITLCQTLEFSVGLESQRSWELPACWRFISLGERQEIIGLLMLSE